MRATCIWCKTSTGEPSVEHIIPEGLGCPEGFVLSGGVVCRACNNGLAHLDRVLIDDFDFFLVQAGMKTKKGKARTINSRGHVWAGRKSDEGFSLHVNMGRKPVQTKAGITLSPYKKGPRSMKLHEPEILGNVAHVQATWTIGENPKTARAITKIALGSLAYFVGPEVALEKKFDPMRRYVLQGGPARKVVVHFAEKFKFENRVYAPIKRDCGNYSIIIRLVSGYFFVDFSPGMSLLPDVMKGMKENGAKGWTTFPIDEHCD